LKNFKSGVCKAIFYEIDYGFQFGGMLMQSGSGYKEVSNDCDYVEDDYLQHIT
jgi:hypothetical protein